jgi:hypothetical protein
MLKLLTNVVLALKRERKSEKEKERERKIDKYGQILVCTPNID